MTLALATYGYYVDWNNDADFLDANENITAYVLSAQWEYGVDWSSVPGRSKIGACRIKLDNSTGLFSSYNAGSAIQASLLPGRAVKITMTIAPAAAVTMWYGYLESILPSPGAVVGVSTAELLAYGPLSQINDTEVHLALQANHTTGALVTHILDAASYSASLRALDTGQSTLSKFFVLRDSNALGVLRELEDAECGLIRETKDGKIAFEDRAHRINAPHDAAIATFGSGGLYHWRMSQEDPLNGICNAIQANVRTFNASETVQLACIVDVRNGLGGAAISIAGSNGTRTVRIEFPTANSSSAYIAVKTWGIVTYEANTAADLSGTDITTDVSAVRTEYADRIEIAFTNANASAGYIVVLKVDGTAIVEGDPIPVKDSDATSQAKYRIRNYPAPSQWLTDIDVAEDYCAHLLALFKDPVPRVTFELMANYDAAHLAQAQTLDVSDRIHLDATAATYSLGISQDCFIEYIRHKVDSGSIHTVEYQCRAVKSNTWAASAVAYTDKTIPSSGSGVPDDLWTTAIPNGLQIIFGGGAWKWNVDIDEGEFRAKQVAAGSSYPDSVDLRTVSEGGTFAHNGTTQYIVTDLHADWSGCQYDLTGGSQGRWFFAFRLHNAKGWSVWSDGNDTPSKVTDYCDTDANAVDGPPEDWSITVKQLSTEHAVIVTATRPAIHGFRIWGIAVQVKDSSTGSWVAIDGASPASVLYDGSAIDHTISLNGSRLMRNAGSGFGTAAVGKLILMDVRGSAFDHHYCQWGTVKAIGSNYVDVQGRFRPVTGVTNDIRIKIVEPPWGWTSGGYLGSSPNAGLWDEWYIGPGQNGNITSESFVSDPIEVPAAVDLDNVQARVWFDNGWSRSDDDTYSGSASGGGSATGEGCIPLTVAAGAVATDVNLGNVFAINSGSNFTLNNPTGSPYCGMTILWAITGAGVPTLGSKFRMMYGETISKSDSRDLLGAIYNAADDEWDAFWKRGIPVASESASASTSATKSSSISASASAS